MKRIIKWVLGVVLGAVPCVSQGQQLIAIQELEDTNRTNVVYLVRKDSFHFFYPSSNTNLPDSSHRYKVDTLFYKTYYFYNSQRQQTGVFKLSYNKTSSSWVKSDTIVIEYDGAINKVRKISRLYWNTNTNQWDSLQVIMYYYSSGKQRFDSALYYSFDAAGARQKNKKVVFNYSGTPLRLTSYYEGIWDNATSSWNWDTTFCYFNSSGQLDSIVSYNDGNISKFVVVARETNVDLLSNNSNTLWLDDDKGYVDPVDSISFNNFLSDIVQMSADIPFGTIDFTLSVKSSSGSNRVEQQELLLLAFPYSITNYKYYYYTGAPPVPASTSLPQNSLAVLITRQYVKIIGPYNVAQISTLDGRLVSTVSNTTLLNTSSLPNGTYILTIEDKKGQVHSVKFNIHKP